MNSYTWTHQCLLTSKDLHHLCADTGCSLENVPGVMDERDGWRERVLELYAVWMTWWWGYICVCVYIYIFIHIDMYINISVVNCLFAYSSPLLAFVREFSDKTWPNKSPFLELVFTLLKAIIKFCTYHRIFKYICVCLCVCMNICW